MLYFSQLKAAAIIGACLLGVLFCIPNLMRAPNGWLPWRQIHLGLDLRGGSYLLIAGRYGRGRQGEARQHR